MYRIGTGLKRKFKWVILILLLTITIHFFLFHQHVFNTKMRLKTYVHISYDSIESILYRGVISSVLEENRPNCTYEHVLLAKSSVEPWNKSLGHTDFSAAGIVNGTFSPGHCNPQFSVAILVPYRNRKNHLDIFLPYMHNFLRRQHIHYKIYVIEQKDDKLFNKGLLYNLGAVAAIADGFPCLILHDVDLLPLNASNLYACANKPHHFSASIDKFNYRLPYDYLVGGVLAIRTDQYKALNGFSHRFWAWGAEDDDFYKRMQEKRIKVVRFPPSMSRYTMLRHAPGVQNPLRWKQMAANRGEPETARAQDGLQGVQEAPALVRRTDHPLYTLLVVNITQGPNETFITQTTPAEH